MKIKLATVLFVCWFLSFANALAQGAGHAGGQGLGGAAPGAGISGATAKLFGENQTFSADLEIQTGGRGNQTMTIPGKIAFDHGKSRFELDLSAMQGSGVNPQTATHMKTMGMDKMQMIARPDKKANYIVYQNLQSYIENPMPEREAAESANDFKLESTELGKETVDGHACAKNKTVVTDKDGKQHESTVWNAGDLKKFPVKIETTEQGTAVTMVFKNVNFTKPDASLFEPPTGFAKYDNMMSMMQKIMSKRSGGGAGAVPPVAVPPKQ